MPRNPLLDVLTPGRRAMPNNPLQMLAEFRKFAQGMTPEAARQQVMQLMSSGKMSQQQFEDLQRQAGDLMQMFGIK